jgi:hypothetical protein
VSLARSIRVLNCSGVHQYIIFGARWLVPGACLWLQHVMKPPPGTAVAACCRPTSVQATLVLISRLIRAWVDPDPRTRVCICCLAVWLSKLSLQRRHWLSPERYLQCHLLVVSFLSLGCVTLPLYKAYYKRRHVHWTVALTVLKQMLCLSETL